MHFIPETQDFSASVLLTHWAWIFCIVGAVLSIVGCLATSLASSLWRPVLPLPFPCYDNQTCLQALPNVPLVAKSLSRGSQIFCASEYRSGCVCVGVLSLGRVRLFLTSWTSPPGSSVHQISQAGIPEWVAISFSNHRGGCLKCRFLGPSLRDSEPANSGWPEGQGMGGAGGGGKVKIFTFN